MKLGYTIFYVEDVTASVHFFCEAFGMEKKFITPENDYGELASGETTLAFVSLGLATQNLAESGGFTAPPKEGAPLGAAVTLLTDDVEKAAKDAQAHGGTLYTAPTKKPWGQTVAYVLDPNRVLIEVATPMAP